MKSRQIIAALALAAVATASPAQTYPAKPIKLIVPFPPGGGTDLFSRTIGQKLAETHKWVVVVENKPGVGGNLGVEQAAKAPPDGYTVVMGQTSNLAINPTLFPKLPYDPIKDLTPVALVASAPLVLVVAANSPFKSLADVVAAAKAKPGELTFASPGNGTVAHLTGELFQNAAGVKFQHIPYKGSSQALTDLMGGQVQIFMSSVPTALSQIKGGKLRALAVTGRETRRRAARRADHRRVRLQGLRRDDLVRPAGPREDAAGNRQASERRGEQGPQGPGGAREARVRRRRGAGRLAGAVRRAPQGRHRPLGQGREGLRRESGLSARARWP